MILASVQTGADTTPFPMYALGVAEAIAGTVLLIAAIGFLWHGPIIRYIERRAANGDAQVRAFVAEVEAWDAEQTALARRVR